MFLVSEHFGSFFFCCFVVNIVLKNEERWHIGIGKYFKIKAERIASPFYFKKVK